MKAPKSPRESLLSIVDIESDPFELAPQILNDDNGRYEETTSELKQWFDTTDLSEAGMIRSRSDEEILRSLGYTQ